MGYTIHSTDPAKHPVPAQYKEGQWFGVGGDGISDTAFFSHPEEYFQYAGGNGAKLEPAFGSSVAYHARDRRKPYTHFFALMPNFKAFRARHMVSDPVPGVDFIGSAMALYACPDDMGLDTLEKITRGEGLPYITFDGKWVRDPSLYGVTLHWSGPRDKCIEYAKALGVKDISRDTGGWYPNLGNSPDLGQVGFANRPPMHFREFTEECHKNGLNHGGLHTLCVFLQGGQCNDVTPAPSAHLQTVCRTTLAKDISPTDTEIVVTDPSFLAEKGTWTCGDGSNFLRIDGEMLYYDGISDAAPWTLKGVKRGHGTKAQEHKAGAEVAKLMQNCYHGFVPDMELLLDYAEYYARMMVANGMDIINFDGFESTIYQNHGYYGTRIFCRRLFETYAKLSGGKYPRVTASNVFAGSWEYLNVCDLGDGPNMFNPHTGRLAIEGKDIGNAFRNSFFPATFGIQDWPGGSITDVENLQAKAVGWDATYVLKVSADTLDKTADQDILAAFRAWQEARAAQVFTKAQKEKLRNPDLKFHLEQTGKTSFVLSEAGEKSVGVKADDLANEVAFENKGETQPLDFVFKLAEPYSAPVSVTGLSMTLPDGSAIEVNRPFRSGERIFCRGGKAWLVDAESKTTELPLKHSPVLPKGGGKFGLCTTGSSKPGAAVGIWTVRVLSAPERIGK